MKHKKDILYWIHENKEELQFVYDFLKKRRKKFCNFKTFAIFAYKNSNTKIKNNHVYYVNFKKYVDNLLK